MAHKNVYRYRFRKPRYVPWDGSMNQPGITLCLGMVLARDAGVKDPAIDLAITRSAAPPNYGCAMVALATRVRLASASVVSSLLPAQLNTNQSRLPRNTLSSSTGNALLPRLTQ